MLGMSRSVTSLHLENDWIRRKIDVFGNLLGLGLGLNTGQKKKGLPSPRAEAGQGNI
jgi:hypothetical protein